MAAPGPPVVGTPVAKATAATANVPVVPGTVAGDTVCILLFKKNNAAVTVPSGFAPQTPQAAATDTVLYAWTRVATATESGTYALSWTGSVSREAVAIRIPGALTTGPLDTGAGAPSGAARGSSANATPAVQLTTQGPDRLLLWVGANFTGGAWTDPSGYTPLYDAGTYLGVAYATQAAAGDTGAVVGTCAASEYADAYLLAFVPNQTTSQITGGDSGTGSESGGVTASVAGGDTGTGSEDGYAAQLVAGGDSGAGSESGYVAQPTYGGDAGTGTESGSASASITSGDVGTGTESGGVAARATGGDSGTGSESGFLRIPGGDTGTGSEQLTSLRANITFGDSGTGSESGYVETLFGDLAVALYAVNPSTGALLALPDYTKLDIAPARNGPGSIRVEYPVNGLNFASLYQWTVGNDRDLEVEIWLTGTATGAMRGYLQEASGDDVDEQAVWTWGGAFLELRADEMVVFPQAVNSANGNAKQEIVFSAVTPGAIVGTLLAQAQGRGTLTDITKGFTNSVDSGGVPWPQTLSTKFSPGAGGAQVLAKLVDLGLIEWAITWTGTARRLDLWAPGNRGADLTTGNRPVVLRGGRNITDSPRKWSVRDSATDVLSSGSEGVYASGSDANARARRGRRIEISASASNLSDLGAVQAYTGVQLAAVTPGVLEVTHGLGFLPGQPRPVIAFNIGDWVFSQVPGQALARLRVVGWSLTIADNGEPSGTVTLNDSMAEALIKIKDRLNALTSGDTTIGTSTSSQDTGTPNAPTGVQANSTARIVSGQPRASVATSWTPPTQNTDGSTITDLAGYTVQWGVGANPSVWSDGTTVNSGTATSGSFDADTDVTIGIRVRAFDQSGNNSAWSATINHTTAKDTSAPAVPSTPVVSNYLGVLKIQWDGNTSAGADMITAYPDFDHVDVHVSTSSNFAPTSATLFDRLFAEGTVVYTDGAYGTTYYAKLIAVDNSGNPSAASVQGSAVPGRVVSLDIFAGAVGTAQLADAAITTAKINNLAVNDAQIGNLSVGKLTAGTLSVAVTLSGIIRTGTTGARSEIDAAGIRLYNSGNTNTVNLKTSDGSALITGSLQTALSGERLVINSAVGEPDTVRVYPSGGGSFATITARTAPSDGSAAILIDGGATTGTARGRIGAYKSEAFISYVTGDSAGDSQAGYSRTAVSCGDIAVNMWAQNRITFARYSGASLVANSSAWIVWANGSITNCPVVGATAQDSGVKFDDGTTCATNAIGTLFGPMKATAFTVASAAAAKTEVRHTREVLDPLAVVRAARPRAYRYRDEIAARGKRAPLRFGVLAEELPAELVDMTPAAAGGLEPSVDLGKQYGVLWAAVHQLLEQRITHTNATASVPAGTRIPAGGRVEVRCEWESSPLAAPTDAVVVVHPGLLGAGRVTAWVQPGSVDEHGATVVFKNRGRKVLVVDPVDGVDDLTTLTASVIGQALYTPPLAEAA